MDMINVKINGVAYSVEKGCTVLEAGLHLSDCPPWPVTVIFTN